MSDKMFTLSFSKEYQKPVEMKDKKTGIMNWGRKNDYPFFLIELLNGSAWHQGIIKSKTFYIAGSGLEVVSGDAILFMQNPYSDYDMNEIVQMLTFDFEVFGAMAAIGTWNREGTRVVRWEFIDIDAVRMSEDERTYYVSDDWNAREQTAEGTNFRSYPALDEDNPVGSFILYYKEPAKKAKGEKGIYPKPAYYGGITAIQTDVDISKFHMYEIQNGFKAGTLINLASGFPETSEEERKIKEQIKGRTQSVEDAGEIIITFSDSTDTAPTVLSLNGNDLSDRYLMTEKSVQQNILVAHSVTSPSLFGIIKDGSFNAAESADLFEIFKMTYVNARQRQIEWMINYMAKLSGAMAVLKLRDVAPIASIAKAIAPINQPTNQPTAPAATDAPVDVAKSALNGAQIASLVEIVAQLKAGVLTADSALQIVLASFPSIDEVQARKIVGLPSVTMSSCGTNHTFSKDELDIFSEYGRNASEYYVIKENVIEWDTPSEEVFAVQDQMFATVGELLIQMTDYDKNVIDMLSRGEDSTAIAKATQSTIQQVAESIAKLTALEVISQGQVTDLGQNIVDQAEAPVAQFEVVYTYKERPGVPPVITKSREFCTRLIGLNRLYTREDINSISNRVDRNVWTYRGGWYTNPETQVSTPYCRHIWVQQLVIKRK
jgi:hypothetical protein